MICSDLRATTLPPPLTRPRRHVMTARALLKRVCRCRRESSKLTTSTTSSRRRSWLAALSHFHYTSLVSLYIFSLVRATPSNWNQNSLTARDFFALLEQVNSSFGRCRPLLVHSSLIWVTGQHFALWGAPYNHFLKRLKVVGLVGNFSFSEMTHA